MDSKTFFVHLKDTCRKLDSDMKEIKEKILEEHDEEISAKKTHEIQDKLDVLKTEAINFRDVLRAKNAERQGFIKTIKELVEESEIYISKKEEHLKQYGYTPMDSEVQVSKIEIENSTPPDKKIMECPVTPILLEYGFSSFPSVSELNQNHSPGTPELLLPAKTLKSHDRSDSTPTLDALDSISAKPEQTPPFPEAFCTPEKKTPPMPTSLATNFLCTS